MVEKDWRTRVCARDCSGGIVVRESARRARVRDWGYGVFCCSTGSSSGRRDCEMPRSETAKVWFTVLAGAMNAARPAAWTGSNLSAAAFGGETGDGVAWGSSPACSIRPTSQISSFSAPVSHERCMMSELIMPTSSTRMGSFHHANLRQLGLEKASESWSRSSVWALSDQAVMRFESSARTEGEIAVDASF